ncbi:MAG: peptidoglycan DD-metalloendopeptidase family protein [Flavobacteriaceae bacterium]|jgi:septal ring factor EnvC (AmiA/AmiB activator)|nr:peptidoglycan DD-metalloendopeptidase family protein [Flavobacteriaceae bacterium]
MKRFWSFLVVFLTVCNFSFAQQKTQQQRNLEKRKEEIATEIAQMERLLQQQVRLKGSAIDQIQLLDNKRYALESLIELTANEVQLLQRQIVESNSRIEDLKDQIEVIKQDYQKVIVNSYKRKVEKNKWLFLLAADSFKDARRRWNYLLQYASYRTTQAERLVRKQEELQQISATLEDQLKQKEEKVEENRRQQTVLIADREKQELLIANARKQERAYRRELADRDKERKRIDSEIDRLIREAIEKANRERLAKAKKANRKDGFVLTPEAEALAKSFEGNKGRHIWPVEKGIKSIGYGTYADKLYPALKHFNNGVTIATESGSKARAIYDGEVMNVMISRQGIKGVYVRHGDYITMYYNLQDVSVKEGDKVVAKQSLGTLHTDKVSGQTLLKFYLYKNTTRLNPEKWVYRL